MIEFEARRRSSWIAVVVPAILVAVLTGAASAAPVLTVHGGSSTGHFGGSLGDAVPDARTGGSAGLSLGFSLRPWLSIQPEILWLRKGGRFDWHISGTISPFDVSGEYQLDYIELPLTLRADAFGGASVRPYILGGAAVAWRVSGSAETRFGGVPENASHHPVQAALPRRAGTADIFEDVGTFGSVDDFRRTDLDLVAGAGVSIGRGAIRGEIEARYFHGMRDVVPSGSFDGYNRTWTLTAGLRIH